MKWHHILFIFLILALPLTGTSQAQSKASFKPSKHSKKLAKKVVKAINQRTWHEQTDFFITKAEVDTIAQYLAIEQSSHAIYSYRKLKTILTEYIENTHNYWNSLIQYANEKDKAKIKLKAFKEEIEKWGIIPDNLVLTTIDRSTKKEGGLRLLVIMWDGQLKVAYIDQ